MKRMGGTRTKGRVLELRLKGRNCKDEMVLLSTRRQQEERRQLQGYQTMEVCGKKGVSEDFLYLTHMQH
jgi:hypothetical protein